MANSVGFSGENRKKWEKEQNEQPEYPKYWGILPHKSREGGRCEEKWGGWAGNNLIFPLPSLLSVWKGGEAVIRNEVQGWSRGRWVQVVALCVSEQITLRERSSSSFLCSGCLPFSKAPPALIQKCCSLWCLEMKSGFEVRNHSLVLI